MVKKDLTQYQRKRFVQQFHKCSKCGDFITNDEPLILVKEPIGRQIRYTFLHERCKYGEEEAGFKAEAK